MRGIFKILDEEIKKIVENKQTIENVHSTVRPLDILKNIKHLNTKQDRKKIYNVINEKYLAAGLSIDRYEQLNLLMNKFEYILKLAPEYPHIIPKNMFIESFLCEIEDIICKQAPKNSSDKLAMKKRIMDDIKQEYSEPRQENEFNKRLKRS